MPVPTGISKFNDLVLVYDSKYMTGHLNKKVLFFLLFFLLLRLVLALVAGQMESGFNDGLEYNQYAHAILENNDWLVNPHYTGNGRPPLYPLFIALIYAVFGLNQFGMVYVFQSIISALTCLFVFKFCQKVFNEQIALLAFIWSGFYVFYLRYAKRFQRETLVFFLFLGLFYYLYLYLTEEKRRKIYFWLAILFYLFLLHLDSKYLFYLPFFFFLFIFYLPLKQGILKYGLFGVSTLLLMIPWTIRNYIAYDGLVLINTNVFDLRNAAVRNPTSLLRMKYKVFHLGKITWTKFEKYPDETERALVKKGYNPNNRSPDELEAIRADVYPATTFLGRKWYNFLQLWKPFDFARSYRPFPDTRYDGKWTLKHNASILLFYGSLLPFMLWSIFNMIRKRDRRIFIFIFPLIVHTLLHVLTWAIDRYRIPIDAFIIMLGIYGMFQLVDRLKSRSLHP